MAMVAPSQLWTIPATMSLLLLCSICFCHISTAAAARSPTPEALLRAAAVRRTRTVLTLTSDVTLTRGVVDVTCPDLAVIGRCKTGGRLRNCKIDGRNRSGAFRVFGSRLNLTNLLLTRLKPVAGHPPIVPASGDHLAAVVTVDERATNLSSSEEVASYVNVDQCSVTNSVGPLFDVYRQHDLELKNTSFINNKGWQLISVFEGGVSGDGLLFRSNQGTIADAWKAGFGCTNCGFENNTLGPLFYASSQGRASFFRSWFFDNKAKRGGDRGAVAYVAGTGYASFCDCRFQRNTIPLPRGRTRIEDVFLNAVPPEEGEGPPLNEFVILTYCPRSAVVAYADPGQAAFVRTCQNCRG